MRIFHVLQSRFEELVRGEQCLELSRGQRTVVGLTELLNGVDALHQVIETGEVDSRLFFRVV